MKTADKQGKEKMKKRLRQNGWDPTTTNLPAVIPIEIHSSFLDLKGFPKFTMVKLHNSHDNLSLFDTDMMFSFLGMLCKG